MLKIISQAEAKKSRPICSPLHNFIPMVDNNSPTAEVAGKELRAGSTVGKVIDGSLENHLLTGMAGVAKIGNDRNWSGPCCTIVGTHSGDWRGNIPFPANKLQRNGPV